MVCSLLILSTLLTTSVVALADTDVDAEAFMQKLWRRYKTAPSLTIRINERQTTADGTTTSANRVTVFCSERGAVRIVSPATTWVHLNGQVLGDSRDFPGTYIAVPTGAAGSAAFKAMGTLFPMATPPFDAGLRMAGSWQDAFKHVLENVGDAGTITLEDGAWPDGAAATLLRAKSGDGEYHAIFYVDKETALLRGRIERFGSGDAAKYVASVSEPELKGRLGQEIRFPTVGRTRFESFDALQADFDERYAMPKPEALDVRASSTSP